MKQHHVGPPASRRAIAFVNADIYTPRHIIRDGLLVVEKGRITHVGPHTDPPRNAEVINVRGAILAPGFVDIHVHGGGGGDFMDATDAAIAKVLRHHAHQGTTSLLATTCTAPMRNIFAAFAGIRRTMRRMPPGAEILGVHMEGPYFAKPEPGCHIAAFIHDAHPRERKKVLKHHDILRLITVAPEIGGALELIHEATELGILVSGGHSGATYGEVRQGVEAGLRHLTHLWSAMSMVKRVNAKRFAGMVEAGLLCDDLTTEVIADGRHLPTSLLRLAVKCKGPDKLCLISDAMRASGMPEGIYEVCGMDVCVENGVALTMDRKAFASSIITVGQAVRHMVQVAGISLLDALRMASLTPAEIAGVAQRKGSLDTGKDADLVCLDPQTLAVRAVMVRGEFHRRDAT